MVCEPLHWGWPRYRYLPGRQPHPLKADSGHRCVGPQADWSLSDPATCAAYRYGLALLNGGYPWEAHEALEQLWRQCPQDHPFRTHVQSLILLAAARVKLGLDDPLRANRTASRAFERVPKQHPQWGVHWGVQQARWLRGQRDSLVGQYLTLQP